MAAYAIQFRRGTTTQHNSFTGLLGEVTVDTDKKTLVVHDGSTTGGFPLAREGANLASAEGSFTSNVSVGGTFSVTSTASFTDDVTITGDLGMTGHIIPSANVTYDLGSTTMMWRDVYVGPGSLYINGQKVLEDNSGTIKMSADENQNIKIESSGTGALQFVGAGGLQIQGEINALTGDLQFGDHLDMNSNRIKELSAPVEGSDAANKTYVDGKISTMASGGTLSFDGVDGDFSGNVAVTGNLTVSGTMTTVNSETIELADNILLLNSNATGTASQNGGIEIERGDDLNVQFLWDETNNRWSFGAEDIYTSGTVIGDVTGTVSSLSNHDTDDLSEGAGNLYYTNTRVDSRFDVNWNLKDTDDLPEGNTNLFYTTARVETVFDNKMSGDNSDSLSEGSTNLYFTDERAQDAALKNVTGGNNITVSYNEATNELTISGEVEDNLSNNDTDDLSEGANNLYYTDARVDARLSSGSLTSINTGNFEVSSSGATFDVDMTFNNGTTNVFNIDASSGDTTIAGGVTINNTMNVEGNTTFAGDNTFNIANSSATNVFAIDVANTTFAIDLDMTVNNASTFNNDITVKNSSNTTLVDMDVTANTYDIAMDLTVNNSATFNNDITVKNSSNTTLVDMDVTANTYDIAMDLTVNNASTFNNNMTINNSSSTAMFDIDVTNATAVFNTDLTVNNDVTINNSSNTTLVAIDVANATYAIDMDLTVNNASTFNNNLTINNSSSTAIFDIDVANTTLDIDLDVTMNNEVTINNTLVVNNGLTLGTSAQGTIRGLVSAGGEISYNSSTGAISFTQDKAFASLTGVPTTVSGYGITDAYTKSEVDGLVSAKDELSELSGSTDDVSEGSTNLYYTDTRADARVANVTGVNLDISNQDTDELSEGSTNLYFTDARAVAAVKSSLSMTHTGVYVVTASDNTGNNGSSHAITAATLGFNVAGKEFYQVFLNRQLLRPTEYTINSSNGTITFSSDVLATDDELEAVIYG